MRPPDRTTFDFHTGVWVRADPTTPRESFEIAAAERAYTEPAPGRWTKPAAPQRSDERLMALLLWTFVTFAIAAIVVRSLALLAVGTVPFALLCALAARRSRDLSVTAADRRLLEDPDDRDVCLLHLTIIHGEREIGRDKGVVWFSHGALLYNGHRTSFAIGSEDVLPMSQWSSAQRNSLEDRFVPLRVERGKAWIEVVALATGNSAGSPAEMRFLKSLYEFLRHPEPSRGPRQLPPLVRG